MRNFFNELIEYNRYCNQKVAEVLINNEAKLTVKTKSLFSHLISAHQIWNARILANQKPFEVWQTHLVVDYQLIDQNNFENSLSILSTFDLDQVINYKTSSGIQFQNSVRDVLFHIINHSTYHRAQIATEFKDTDIAPVNTDWITYKR